jgi:hypothetical protein
LYELPKERNTSSKKKIGKSSRQECEMQMGEGIYTPMQQGKAGHEQPGDRET